MQGTRPKVEYEAISSDSDQLNLVIAWVTSHIPDKGQIA